MPKCDVDAAPPAFHGRACSHCGDITPGRDCVIMSSPAAAPLKIRRWKLMARSYYARAAPLGLPPRPVPGPGRGGGAKSGRAKSAKIGHGEIATRGDNATRRPRPGALHKETVPPGGRGLAGFPPAPPAREDPSTEPQPAHDILTFTLAVEVSSNSADSSAALHMPTAQRA